MEDRKCQEWASRTGKEETELTATEDYVDQERRAKFDNNAVPKVNGSISYYHKDNVKKEIEGTNGDVPEVSSEHSSLFGNSSNNGLIKQEEECNFVIKREIFDEEPVESAEIVLKEKITVKSEESGLDVEKYSSVSNGDGEECNCSLESKSVGAKKTLDFLIHSKVTSLKRNRSSHDLQGDDDERKSKVSSCAHVRPASLDSSENATRTRSISSRSDSSGMSPRSGRNLPKKHKGEEVETDPVILARRQKQIDYGKNTTGYKRYEEQVPKDRRSRQDPVTPPKYVKYSRRGWDGLIKAWRRRLHNWDPPRTGNDDDDGSFLSESPVPTVSDDSENLMDVQTDSSSKELLWADEVEAAEEAGEFQDKLHSS